MAEEDQATRLTIQRSRGAVYGALVISTAIAVWSIVVTNEPMWERILLAAIGGGGALLILSRLHSILEPVLVIDPSGVRDSRLEPSFIPRSLVRAVYFEPSYFRGGALVVTVEGVPPEPRRQFLLPAINEQRATRTGREIRLPLTGFKYDRERLKSVIGTFTHAKAGAV